MKGTLAAAGSGRRGRSRRRRVSEAMGGGWQAGSRQQGQEAVHDHVPGYTTQGEGVGRRPLRRLQPHPSDRGWRIALSRSTVRRVLLADGVRSPRRRRASKRYSRRERYPQEGMLLQIDGSRHDWLEGRGPYRPSRCCGRRHREGLLRPVQRAGGPTGTCWLVDHHGVPLALATGMASSIVPQTSPRPSLSSSKAGLIPLSSAEHCRSWTSVSSWPTHRRRKAA